MTRAFSRSVVGLCVALAMAALVLLPMAAWAGVDESGQLKAAKVTAGEQDTGEPATYGDIVVPVKDKSGHIMLKKKYLIALATDSEQLSKLVGSQGSSVKVVDEVNNNTVKWLIEYNRAGVDAYTIKNSSTGKKLSVSGSVKEGATVSSGGSNKYWDITQTKDGFVIKPHGESKLALTVDGSRFTIEESDGSKEQRFWMFDPENWKTSNVLKNGTYTLSPKSTKSRLLAIKGNSTKNNTTAVVAAKSANAGRQFEITNVTGQYYKIISVMSGKALTASGKKVVQSTFKKGNKSQQWKATVSKDGQIVFTNRKTGALLTGSNAAAKMEKGKASKATEAQRWVVSPTVTSFSRIEQKALSYANKCGARVKGAYKTTVNRKTRTVKKKQFYLSIDMTTHTEVIFYRPKTNSPWTIKHVWTVSTGKDHNTAVANRLTTGRKKYTNSDCYEEGYSAYYWTGLNWGSWNHTILYYPGTHNIKDSRLGYSISGGCVRLAVPNAIWVYNNIPQESGVSTYY